jgi:hypothetical protein
MPTSASRATEAPALLRAYACAPVWRVIAGVLVAISGASLPVILVVGLLSSTPVPLAAWVRALVPFAAAPALLAALIHRAVAVEVEVRPGELVLRRRRLRLEIPCEAIARIRPWVVPLPGTGFSLWMRSGRRLRYGLHTPEIARLLATLADLGEVGAVRALIEHPTVVYAQAKRSVGPWRWYHLAIKFVLFALAPAAIWFNLNQHIGFGGTLGQYYLEGLGPYLKTFAIHWGLVLIYLILYASVWRGLTEALALLAAWAAPARAAGVRRAAEIASRLLYYVGVPVIVVLPFLQ